MVPTPNQPDLIIWPVPLEAFPEGLPLHVRHDVVERRAGLARVEQRQDVGVLEPGGGLDLGQEALGSDPRGQFGLQDLDRHRPVML